MATPVFDPVVMRLGRLVAEAVESLREVHVVTANAAPRFDASGRGPNRTHRHAVPTTVVPLEGVTRLMTAAGDLDLRPGALAIIAPAAWHAHAPLRADAVACHQGLLFGRCDVNFYGAGRALVVMIPAEPSTRLLGELLATRETRRRRQLACELLAQITAGPAEEVNVPPAVTRMARRLWHGLDRPLRAATVLAAGGVGPRQALRLFRSYFGTGPKQVIRSQQLALAAALLAEGLPIAQVAAETGFPDRRSFTRAWRLAHGVPPTGMEP